MKNSKIAAGIGTLILAAGSALTSAKSFALNVYWYIDQDSQECVQTTLPFDCTVTGNPDCVRPAGSPSENLQIFLTRNCTIPLGRV